MSEIKTSIGLGETEPDPVGDFLGTGYHRFVSPIGISGLAKESKDRVDILAVESHDPGKGNFKFFISHCQMTYRTVCVWEDWNPIIGPMLARRGFKRARQTERDGEKISGWRWDRSVDQPLPIFIEPARG